jgi:hypothetical protein
MTPKSTDTNQMSEYSKCLRAFESPEWLSDGAENVRGNRVVGVGSYGRDKQRNRLVERTMKGYTNTVAGSCVPGPLPSIPFKRIGRKTLRRTCDLLGRGWPPGWPPTQQEDDMDNMINNLDRYSRWLAYLAIAAAFAWIIIPSLLTIWVTP